MSRALELLAPARDLECGIAAIDHGADAVYVGAGRFGARAMAGNSVEDIARLCDHAHAYMARVYVTVNTILMDGELEAARDLVHRLHGAGVDAILVQDMGLLKLGLPPIELHASTQADCRSAGKARWLRSLGFTRVVLARELSLDGIARIHAAVPDLELEVFVHGALCASYSGLCNASQYCFHRSANRGECAQFCRLGFDLEDASGRTVVERGHLLSLKDMCRLGNLEDLARAGATSFKIEGRLKDAAYVKNVTAAYSEELSRVCDRNPGLYRRQSLGKCTYSFTPDVAKSFNRGFTDYFLRGRGDDIASMDTPKSKGEPIGRVRRVMRRSFLLSPGPQVSNGDGLCFMAGGRGLVGFRVNRVAGQEVFPRTMPRELRAGDAVYRNLDRAFVSALFRKSSERRIPIDMSFREDGREVELAAGIGGVARVAVRAMPGDAPALNPQEGNLARQLSRLGDTPFTCASLKVDLPGNGRFVPSSVVADMRRRVVGELSGAIAALMARSREERGRAVPGDPVPLEPYPEGLSHLYNVSNRLAREFYAERGVAGVADAFELRVPGERLLMQCRHCLARSLGHCARDGGRPWGVREPLHLRLADGRRFRLGFDCDACQMNVYAVD